MKRKLFRLAFVALAAALAAPAALQAQQTTERKEVQVITITRSGDKKEKTIVEIDGDKVKVNGKDAKENKDVSVRVTTRPPGRMLANVWVGPNEYNIEADGFRFFDEDPNRAMLGVVTEGNDKGAEVISVTKETAAEKAGLKKGDIITRINDKKIESTDDLNEAIRAHKPGDKVTITFLREGKEQKITAELGKYKGLALTATLPRMNRELERLRDNITRITPPEPPRVYVQGFGRPRLGVSIQDTDEGKGVKVLDVDEDSQAAKAGVKKGDIITQVDDKAISSVDEVRWMMMEKKEGSTLRLQVLRNGKTENIEVKFPKRLRTADL